ncbi:MAG: hypothetical protein IKB02_07015 [Clostridia bacterium]|nr:hypothetical protein [Clostridia bacterium]
MKLLIAYSSKNGVARRCAEMLASFLSPTIEYDLVDLASDTPDLSAYDCAVLGGSIRMAKLSKELRAFLKKNRDVLSNMESALYICCGYSHLYEEYRDISTPRKCRFSLGVHHFGGELKPDKLHGFDRLVVRSMRKRINEADFEDSDEVELSLPEIIPENVKLVAESIKKLERL